MLPIKDTFYSRGALFSILLSDCRVYLRAAFIRSNKVRSPGWRFLKTEIRIRVDGRKERFSNTMTSITSCLRSKHTIRKRYVWTKIFLNTEKKISVFENTDPATCGWSNDSQTLRVDDQTIHKRYVWMIKRFTNATCEWSNDSQTLGVND